MEALGAQKPDGLRSRLREGIALAELNLPLPEVHQVRRGSVAALCLAVLHVGRTQGRTPVEMSRAILGVADRP